MESVFDSWYRPLTQVFEAIPFFSQLYPTHFRFLPPLHLAPHSVTPTFIPHLRQRLRSTSSTDLSPPQLRVPSLESVLSRTPISLHWTQCPKNTSVLNLTFVFYETVEHTYF